MTSKEWNRAHRADCKALGLCRKCPKKAQKRAYKGGLCREHYSDTLVLNMVYKRTLTFDDFEREQDRRGGRR